MATEEEERVPVRTKIWPLSPEPWRTQLYAAVELWIRDRYVLWQVREKLQGLRERTGKIGIEDLRKVILSDLEIADAVVEECLATGKCSAAQRAQVLAEIIASRDATNRGPVR